MAWWKFWRAQKTQEEHENLAHPYRPDYHLIDRLETADETQIPGIQFGPWPRPEPGPHGNQLIDLYEGSRQVREDKYESYRQKVFDHIKESVAEKHRSGWLRGGFWKNLVRGDEFFFDGVSMAKEKYNEDRLGELAQNIAEWLNSIHIKAAVYNEMQLAWELHSKKTKIVPNDQEIKKSQARTN